MKSEHHFKTKREPRSLKIERIKDEGDRVLLYGENDGYDYYVVASPVAGRAAKVGDTVIYEPCGGNFGWLAEEQA